MAERISMSIARIDLNHQNYDNSIVGTQDLDISLQGIVEVLFQVYQTQAEQKPTTKGLM